MGEEGGPRPGRRARSAYQLFLQEKRTHGGSSRNFLTEAAQQWGELSLSERRVFIERADRERELVGVGAGGVSAQPRAPRRLSAATFQELLRDEPRLLASITPEAVGFLGDIVQCFASELLQRTHTQALKNGKAKLTPDELMEVARNDIRFAFLRDLPRPEESKPVAPAGTRPAVRASLAATSHTLDGFFAQ